MDKVRKHGQTPLFGDRAPEGVKLKFCFQMSSKMTTQTHFSIFKLWAPGSKSTISTRSTYGRSGTVFSDVMSPFTVPS